MRVDFVARPPADRAAARGRRLTIVCPWLGGLPKEAIWITALPIHDVNGFLDSDERFVMPAASAAQTYFGVFALDRFRAPDMLFDRLRAKGIGRIVNLPTVSFFDGRSSDILESLRLGSVEELDFLRHAKAAGFGVGFCARDNQLASVKDTDGFDFLLRHDGPGSRFELQMPAVLASDRDRRR